jgi:hypothetical protein
LVFFIQLCAFATSRLCVEFPTPYSVDARMKKESPRVSFHKFEDMLGDSQVEALLLGVADQYHVALARRAVETGQKVRLAVVTGGV